MSTETWLCLQYIECNMLTIQWRSQNAEKVAHIKGRLLDQAVILFHCVLFSKLKENLLPEGANSCSQREQFFPLTAVPYGKENPFYYIR